MKNTFLNRVDAERKVLSIVNRYSSSDEQLAGLSSAAIADWQLRFSSTNRNDAATALRSLADACQVLSDRSHETFAIVEALAAEKFLDSCAGLEALLKKP